MQIYRDIARNSPAIGFLLTLFSGTISPDVFASENASRLSLEEALTIALDRNPDVAEAGKPEGGIRSAVAGGTGCLKCKKLTELTQQAVKEPGNDHEIDKATNIN